MSKKKYIIGFLTFIILTSSFYIMLPDKVKVSVENTRTRYYVLDDSWDLAGTEYVNLFDGTKKMRAKSRELYHVSSGNIVEITRLSLYKDNISTFDKYVFNGGLDDVEMVPISHDTVCYNCVGKILHYEYRDISYDGITTKTTSPVVLGKNMKVEFQDNYYYAKLTQSKYASDKLVVRYRPIRDVESFSVRMFDPPLPSFINSTNNEIQLTFNNTINDSSSNNVNASYRKTGDACYDFRLEQNSNDVCGSNDGVDTSVTYSGNGFEGDGTDKYITN